MADKPTVTMYPPSGGSPVEVVAHEVTTMTGRGWSDKPPRKTKPAKVSGAEGAAEG